MLQGSADWKMDFSASRDALPAKRLRRHKELGRDVARTGDPNQPKEYSIPYDIVISNKTGGRSLRAGHCHCSGTG